MSEDKTVEVDASELSDGVIEDLVEEGGLDEGEAEELGDDVWFDEVEMREPRKEGLREYLSNRFDNATEFAQRLNYRYREHKTVFAEVTDVERTDNDNVRVTVMHQRSGEDSFTLSPDSVELVNLLAYHSVDSPKGLVGERILLDPNSFGGWSTTVVIPHNVAWTGKIRFGVYSFVSEINQKTKWESLGESDDPVELAFLTFFPCAMVAAFASAISGAVPSLLIDVLNLPILLWGACVAALIGFGLFRLITILVLSILESDFESA